MIVCCIWLSIGMAIDAWAHRNIPALETFFTPWHGVFYSGFGAVAGLVGLTIWRNRQAGYSWRLAAPRGYAAAPIALAIFAAGGAGDAIWHELLGVEKDLAALLSPTHLLLFTGITILVTSPLRSAWQRDDGRSAPSASEFTLPLLSVVLAVTMFSFITQSMSPFVEPLAARRGADALLALAPADPSGAARIVYVGQALGVAGFLVQTTLLVGALLPLLRRWRLPFGTATMLLTLNVALQVAISELYWLIPVAALAGLAADVLIRRLVRPDGPTWAFRLAAAALPLCLWSFYMAALGLGLEGGLAWDLDLWTGTVLATGALGLLLSFLVVPLGRGAPVTLDPDQSERGTRARLGSQG